MRLVFLFPILLIGFIPFSFAEIEYGINYDKEVISVNANGGETVKFTTIGYERISDGENYKDYLFSDNIDTLEIKTAKNTIKLDKTTCSFSFYNSNNTLLFQDSIIAFQSIVDQYTWNGVTSVNNAACQAYFDEPTGSLVAKKHSASTGFMEYKYIWNGAKWKTQLEATNLSGLTNRVFGFDQTVELNTDTIHFGNTARNLDNFNGQTFNRTFLENNQAKILNFLNGYSFDFDIGFDYLDSITVIDTGANKSKLVFHFMRNNEILLPNETLIIDPTLLQNVGGVDRQLDSTGGNGWGELVTSASALNGFTLDEVSVWLRTPSSSTGTITFGVWDLATNTQQHSFGTFDSSTLTGSYVKYTRNTGSYVLQTDDIFGVKSALSAGFTFVDTVNSNQYDTTNTRLAEELSGTWGAPGDLEMRFEIIYTVPAASPDSITDLTADSVGTTTASLSFTPPNLNGETLINYMLNVTTPQQDTPPSTFWMNGSSSPFSVVGLTEGTDYSASASAYTAGGGNWTLANVLNFTTNIIPDGILSITTGNVGDTIKVESSMNVTQSIPLPANVTALKLYKDNILVKTDTIFVSISTLNNDTTLDNLWYQITDDSSHDYALAATLENTAGSIDILSTTNATITREYDPSYLPAIDNPSTQGSVNATIERFDDQDGLLLKVNRIGVSTGDTWQIECIAQTNSEAAQTKNQSLTWEGDWQNETNTGYFNTTYTGFVNSHAYVTCFNEDELFSITSFTNSSLALLGIQLFDDSYGAMLGVPVGVFFLVMTAGMANKRTAPTFIIVITGIAGTMATIGFFSFDPLVWGLALVTAMLGIFVNQKIF